MEALDRELQHRVWERVCRMPELGREDLGAMVLPALENAAAYGRLAARGERLRRLRRDARACAACLLGMADPAAKRPVVSGERGEPEQLLRRCCVREQRLWNRLQTHTADPELGPVFQLLAHRTAQRWMTVLELLGEPRTPQD